MKRILLMIAAIAIVAAIGVAGYLFYDQHLRGLKPALLPPSEDITKTINTTGMPLTLPAGFSIEIFAKDLGGARVLAMDSTGTVLVSSPDRGAVYAIVDGRRVTVADKLNKPHGLAFTCTNSSCTLYVAETNKLVSFDYDSETKHASNKQTLAELPSGGEHVTRTIIVNPADPNQLLVAVGSTCNVCHESDPRRAAISVFDLSTHELKPYATGLRNSVFMTPNPVDGSVWATEMGRDNLGDNLPPDEINIIEKANNYGWPNCYGNNIHDSVFDKNTYIRNPCMLPFETPAHVDLQAHSAPLGLAFIPEEGWPEDQWYNLLVAFHGSWNRSVPTGYKIVRIKLNSHGDYQGTEDFVTGWLRPNGTAIGRPVDILVQPGGTMYVSDDKAGVIYRIFHAK